MPRLQTIKCWLTWLCIYLFRNKDCMRFNITCWKLFRKMYNATITSILICHFIFINLDLTGRILLDGDWQHCWQPIFQAHFGSACIRSQVERFLVDGGVGGGGGRVTGLFVFCLCLSPVSSKLASTLTQTHMFSSSWRLKLWRHMEKFSADLRVNAISEISALFKSVFSASNALLRDMYRILTL